MKKLIIFLGLVFCGCSSTKDTTDKGISESRFIYDTKFGIGIIVDQETKLEYLVVSGSGVCPIYNPDGTLKIHKEE